MKKEAIRTTFLDTLPVLTGYLFLGFGFGVLMNENGYGIGWSLCMSLFIYAGSMQYVAISLLAGSAGLLTVAMTTFLVNARHLFYGISMVDAYKGAGKKEALSDLRPYRRNLFSGFPQAASGRHQSHRLLLSGIPV